MKVDDFLIHAAPAAAICAAVAAIYLSAGLVPVLVTAALFDCALRGVETLRERRARAPASAESASRDRM
jgi:hypothetical protein